MYIKSKTASTLGNSATAHATSAGNRASAGIFTTADLGASAGYARTRTHTYCSCRILFAAKETYLLAKETCFCSSFAMRVC